MEPNAAATVVGNRGTGDGDFVATLGDDGVLDITIRGLWATEQVDRFFAAIMRCIVGVARSTSVSVC